MNHKTSTRVLASVLAAGVTGSMILPTAAAEKNTPKEEVAYVNLNADGSVKEINVVNIFDLTKAGTVVDYGNYESVRNMTTTDSIDYADDTVRIDTKGGRLYYEGRLNSKDIPWNIRVEYYLNGKKYKPEELAGKSGALEIKLSVRQNPNCDESFFDAFALQASVTLDTKRCGNIVADGATEANVGSDKQLIYTILPGKETDLSITADVVDFEMDGIAINGIPLSLNIEVDDEELMDEVTELMDAIEQLDDGAGELKDGASELQSGAKTGLSDGVKKLTDGTKTLQDGASGLKDGGGALQSGAGDLQDGAAALDDGLNALHDGILRIQSGLSALDEQSSALTDGASQLTGALEQIQSELDQVTLTEEDLNELVSASSEISKAIDSIASGLSGLEQNASVAGYKAAMQQNGLDIDALKQQNASAAGELRAMAGVLREQIQPMQKAGLDCSSLEEQIDKLEGVAQLLEVNNAGFNGTEQYMETLHSSISQLASGAAELKTGYETFDQSIGSMVTSLGELAYQLSELSGAIDTLVEKSGELETGIQSYTGGVAQVVAGYEQIADAAAQLVEGSDALRTGTESLYDGTSELLNGITEFYNGTGTLRDGSGQLDEGVAKLLTGIAQLYSGTEELKDGTGEMRDKTSGMDSKIQDQIDELLDSITGDNIELVSFVSERNTEVDSVQFVIQTDGIAQPDAEEAAADETEHKSIWQKLLSLFGLE